MTTPPSLPMPSDATAFPPVADVVTDHEASRYDPQPNNYDLTLDPRCLWGWGPPVCNCRLGHACFRAFGHRGKCIDGGERREGDLPCSQRQRPKDWDTHGRAEANR